MSKSFQDEARELQEAMRELAYTIYRGTRFKWVVRKLGMLPKDWIREREERDAQSTGTESRNV